MLSFGILECPVMWFGGQDCSTYSLGSAILLRLYAQHNVVYLCISVFIHKTTHQRIYIYI